MLLKSENYKCEKNIEDVNKFYGTLVARKQKIILF